MDDWYVISNVDRIDSPALAFYPDRISGTSMGSIAFSPIAVRKEDHRRYEPASSAREDE